MTITLMQPYFFPYIGYFSLVHSVEHFVFFDDVQFNRQSWMVRNTIVNFTINQPHYIRPGIQTASFPAKYKDIKLANNQHWKDKLLAQLRNYKSKSAFFKQEFPFIEQLILSVNCQSLVEFNTTTTQVLADYLGFTTSFTTYSNHKHWVNQTQINSGTWGLHAALNMGATTFINPPGGESFMPAQEYAAHGVKLGFVQPNLNSISARSYVSGMSILDVLLCNGKEATAELARNYTIKWVN